MTRDLVNILRHVQPAGRGGFEGLIADSLKALTGTHFNLADAGYQEGRDMTSRPITGNVIAVECKRYGATRQFNKKELLGALVQVELAIRDLDLWILVTSRSVDSKLAQDLHSAATEHGLSFFALSSADGDPSSLEALLAHSPEITAKHPAFSLVATPDELRPLLKAVTERPNFRARIRELREAFGSPLVGYENWRIQQNEHFMRTLRSFEESHASYGQILNIEDPGVTLIKREALWVSLDKWMENGISREPFAVVGAEGNGKTWGVTSWIAEKIKSDPNFPGIIFCSSGNIYEDEFRGGDLNPFFSRAVAQRLTGITKDQSQRRLLRWTSRHEGEPLFLLVLDGLNEHHSPMLWRGLLVQLGGELWSTHVRVLITCRTEFWQDHFAGLRSLPAKTFTLDAFDDIELDAALDHHQLKREEIPQDVLRLIRKPRYFDLMIKDHKHLAESGDITEARLVYEDWRDRYERKRSIRMSDEEFQNVLRGLVEVQRTRTHELTGAEVKLALPPDLVEQEEVIREFQTGGILRPHKNKFRIDKKLLVYGFGLLLVDQLEEASLAAEDPHKAIASWLEPHADMDIKAAICEHVVLHALTSNTLPLEFKVALLVAWVSNHNQTETAENSLTAYVPLCPEAYVSLSEVVWSTKRDIRWIQELLTRAFIRWYESPQVAPVLVEGFERWLGFVHVSGSSFRREQARISEVQDEMASRVGHQVTLGPFNFAGYTFTGIDDDGHVRLSRVALAVISHLPRKRFIRALVIGSLTEIITGTPNRHELLAWVFRTSRHDLWPFLKEEINQLLQTENAVLRRAAKRLLSFEGSNEASQLQKEIPSETTEQNVLSERHREDPCTSGMAWSAAEVAICIEREDLDPRWVAQRIAKHCINPDLNVSETLRGRLRSLIQEIQTDDMWVVTGTTGADHTFETYEPVLAAFAPDVLAELVRSVIKQIPERQGMKRRQVSLHLEEHLLILGKEEIETIRMAWQDLLRDAANWGEAERVAEKCLFKVVLLQQDGTQQLVSVLDRPEGAFDLITYENAFLPLTSWQSVEGKITGAKDANSIRRILWFLAVNSEVIPPHLVRQFVVPLLNHGDSHVRSKACQVIYQTADELGISELIHGGWHWEPQDDSFQNHWASLILSEFGTRLPLEEVFLRVHPSYWGYAVTRRGNKAEEIQSYAEIIGQLLLRIANSTPDLPLDLPPFEVESRIDAKVQDIRRRTLPAKLFNRSIRFVDFSLTRGGDESRDDFRPEDFNESVIEEQPERFRAIVQDAINQQHSAGNVLFGQEFYTEGLDQIVKQRPDLITSWLSRINPNTREGRGFIRRASSFCAALCKVLLREQVETGIELYWKLQESESRIRVIDHDTQMDLLDFALFDVAPSEVINRAWERKIEQSYSDLELLKVATLSQHGKGGEWLWSYTAERLHSRVPIDKARARVILGFIDKPEALLLIKNLMEPSLTRGLGSLSKNHRNDKIGTSGQSIGFSEC